MKYRAALLLSRILNPRVWAFGLFWSWNIIFVAFMLLGFVPQVLPSMIDAFRLGTIPVLFVILAVILVTIPVGAVFIGVTVLRRSPGRLIAMGYGIEGPLMFMLAIRFFVLRDANAGIAGHLTVPGATTEEWLDSGQCTDCFIPAFNFRPGGSTTRIVVLCRARRGFTRSDWKAQTSAQACRSCLRRWPQKAHPRSAT